MMKEQFVVEKHLQFMLVRVLNPQGCVAKVRGASPLSRHAQNRPKTIGEHIRKRRLELKLLQKELANKLGVDECTITNWKKNHSSPMLHLLPKIIEFLGYDPSYNPSEPKTLGERALQYRKSCGITQKELARQIGIDPTMLSRLERKRDKCSSLVLKKVEAFFNHLSPQNRISVFTTSPGNKNSSIKR